MAISKTYSWVVVGLLWVVALLNYLDRQMISTMRPAMELDIKELQTATYFGYLMSVFLWIYGLMSPFSGLIADRINRKWLIVVSLFVWSAVTFSMGFATNFNQLYVLRALMGVSEALYIPAALSLIADYHGSKTLSLAIGLHMTGFYVGQALGGFGGTIAGIFSWKETFHYLGFIGIAYAVVLGFLLREKRAIRRNELIDKAQKKSSLFTHTGKVLGVLLSNMSFWIILIYFASPSLPGWAIKNWLPTLLSQNLQIPMSQAGPLATITIAVSSLIGVLVGGTISDRWVQTHARGRIFTSAIGLGLTIPALILIAVGGSIASSVLAAILFGIGYGVFDANNMPILCQIVPPEKRATAYGIMNMTGVFAGAFITNQLGKSIDAGNIVSDFVILGAVVLVAIMLQLFFLTPGKNENLFYEK